MGVSPSMEQPMMILQTEMILMQFVSKRLKVAMLELLCPADIRSVGLMTIPDIPRFGPST